MPSTLTPSAGNPHPFCRQSCNNSEKTASIRTIRDFSLEAQPKLTGEKWFDVYEGYWATPDYADAFTTAACNGTGAFEGASLSTRAEGCLKGAQ